MSTTKHNTTETDKGHTDLSNTPEDFGTFMRKRLNGKDIFGERIQKVDFVASLRNTQQDVLDGSATLNDLHTTNLFVNLRYDEEEIRKLNSATEEKKEALFPRRQLCEHMGITEEQYKAIDAGGRRRDAFVLLKTMFKNASQHEKQSNKKIPHMLLIEELVNTLNTKCIGKFLYDTAQSAIGDEVSATQAASWPRYGAHPDEKRLFVRCIDPDKITVRAEYSLYPKPQPDLGIKVRIAYDVEVCQDKFISYQNIHAVVVFPRTPAAAANPGMPEWEIVNTRKKVFDGVSSLTQYPDPAMAGFVLDYDLQGWGFAMDAMLVGKTFTAQSLLSTTLQEVKLPENRAPRAKDLTNAAKVSQPKTENICEIASKFFMRVTNGFYRFFSYIKDVLFSCKSSKTRSTFTKSRQTSTEKLPAVSTLRAVEQVSPLDRELEKPKLPQREESRPTPKVSKLYVQSATVPIKDNTCNTFYRIPSL
ncbi:hypothetical protein ANPL_03330 [Anaplasma platys]|uniref:Uncharacterized protein n=1 Tax=Anaplasma platys TaxID=949 RepID=A0A858PYT2_9RICK|nr:hypothetical protein [Anaplasma platys]QJC27724.1 hypothetical protein ANPL_03330 [Anaplasma platys]